VEKHYLKQKHTGKLILLEKFVTLKGLKLEPTVISICLKLILN